jgi:hypothetical protein
MIPGPGTANIPDLRDLETRLARLEGQAQTKHADFLATWARAEEHLVFLDTARLAEARLDAISRELLGEILDEIGHTMTQAIAEILGQEREVVLDKDLQRGKLAVNLVIRHHGEEEDVMVGQGGSVANILSVSLRLMALAQLDPHRHRPFLVLDEQDCWLKPELVPAFMKLIARIADRLELQVLVISHHPLDLFSGHAARIYGLLPSREQGVGVKLMKGPGEGGSEGGSEDEVQDISDSFGIKWPVFTKKSQFRPAGTETHITKKGGSRAAFHNSGEIPR